MIVLSNCASHLDFLQCLQQSQVSKFCHLNEVDIRSDSYHTFHMKTDELLNEIFKRAPNLNNLSFSIQENEFLNDNFKFEFNNLNLLDCVKILLPSETTNPEQLKIVEQQLKNITRLLLNSNSNINCNYQYTGILTKKLVFSSGRFQHAGIFLNQLRSRLGIIGNINGCDDGNDAVAIDGLARLEHFEFQELGTFIDCDKYKTTTVTTGDDIINMLVELNELIKINRMIKIDVPKFEHCTGIHGIRCHDQANEQKQDHEHQGISFNHHSTSANAVSFSQFSRICDLIHEINVNSNDNNNNKIEVRFMFINAAAAKGKYEKGDLSDGIETCIWGLPSTRIFGQMGFIRDGPVAEEKSGLTFEECVKKFNKHKIGVYRHEYNNNVYYRKCFIMKSNPSCKSIILQFVGCIDSQKRHFPRYAAITKNEFPTKNVQFDIERYNVDSLCLSTGLDAKMWSYKENEKPVDEGCQFYFNNQLIKSTSQFEQILRSTGGAYCQMKSTDEYKWFTLFSDAHGYWLPPDNLNTIRAFVNCKGKGFAEIVLSSKRCTVINK